MKTAICGCEADDVPSNLKRCTTVKTGETRNPNEFVETEVDSRFVGWVELPHKPVCSVNPWPGCELDVIVQWRSTGIVRVTHPRFTVVIRPANPGRFKTHHVNVEHSVCDRVDPSIRIARERRLRDVFRIDP